MAIVMRWFRKSQSKEKDLTRELALKIGYGVIEAAQNDRRLRRALMSSAMAGEIAETLNLIYQIQNKK
jgi:hypothetical protein